MDVDSGRRTQLQLMEALRTYGIQASEKDVEQALGDPECGQSFAEWSATHLGYDNLLTPDELALYTALDKNGHVDRLAALHDLAEIQAFSENDMKVAIAELARSTEAISKQTETLRQQQDALARFVQKQADGLAQWQALDQSRQRKVDGERKHLQAEVNELVNSIGIRVSELEQQKQGQDSELQSSLRTAFESDDKLLTSLQKLGWDLDQPDPEETRSVQQLRDTSLRLIKITVESIRTKLDAVYVETLVNAERSGSTKPASASEVKDLQDEVESLYSEILPVAQMSVEQQHLEPALKSVEAHSGQTLQRTAAALEYINECLDYLFHRANLIHERIDTHKSHQAAANALAARANAELSIAVSQEDSKTAATTSSPVRSKSPVRKHSRVGSRSHRRSSSFFENPPLQALFQSLGLSSTQMEGLSTTQQLATLSQVIGDRSAKSDDVALDVQENFEVNTASHLRDAKRAVQLLHDSLFAETPFGRLKMADPELDMTISVLAQEVDKASDTLAKVNVQASDGSSEKRQELLQRWGRSCTR